ncbi:SDR family oxidoreductase [Streptomyces caniscabiei]|uniref:SDR family NAD(P)-dependent oxidoreductase n=1 Tax=Streptomyces caniscabiei TaxID=2746961 RepID=UPI0029B5AC88|nr:SDR family oxidoreductase [Streptomyces caniscabiei]MDX2604279.1 SDR family oxidoreductase [Streptomyces caniscabiei]MDX2735621.1 SDR family oxidoreductase [Streptomyces caniscabiei]MDX2780146.1 SDR family oxidoreductase [Streptomyces caniscabiei]
MKSLSNKVAVITGGSSGVGLATAQRFVEEGAVVYVTGRRQQELEAAAAKVGAIAVQGDASNPADLDRLYDTVRGDGRRIDVLVANAGTSAFAKLEDVTDDMVDEVFNTNVKGTLNTVKKGLPLLTDGASIVLVGSVSGSTGPEGFSVYSASKAAVRSFARGWANELKGRKIRVNVVAPGTTDTPGIGSGVDEATKRAFMERLSSEVPLGRWGRPQEQADAILFLASEQSSYITGFELVVDGGATQLGPFG